MIATNLTSICCAYMKKIVKNVSSKNEAFIKIEEVETYDLDRKKIKLISNK